MVLFSKLLSKNMIVIRKFGTVLQGHTSLSVSNAPPKGKSSNELESVTPHAQKLGVTADMEPSAPLVPSVSASTRYNLLKASCDEVAKNSTLLKAGVVTQSDLFSACKCALSFLEIFLAYGFEPERGTRKELTLAVERSIEFWILSEIHWIKYFKYRSAAFFASHMGDQELPIPPYELAHGENPCYLFGGLFYGFQRRLFRDVRKRDSFCTSILIGAKKDMPLATDDMVKEAEYKNLDTMTTPKPEVIWTYTFDTQTGVNLPVLDIGRPQIEHEIVRSTLELFRGWRPTLESLTKPYLPSTKSNYINTRGKTGSYKVINDLKAWRNLVSDVGDEMEGVDTALVETVLWDYSSPYFGEKGTKDEELHRKPDDTEMENPLNELEAIGLQVDTRRFESGFKRFYWSVAKEALNEIPAVKVVGLKEPLKIRCISKGPPLTYFALKPLQASIHTHLRQQEMFRLIGTPITEEDMKAKFDRFLGTHRFHSGDYSAATDELYSWASNAVAKALEDLTTKTLGYSLGPLWDLFKRALTGHVYEDDRDNTMKPQERGQLMGSIVSFPILCVLNATLVRMAYEWSTGTKVSFRDLPCWINGDDCLTAYPKGVRFPYYWENLARVFGFSKSVGKTYDSDRFCSMNSTTFACYDEAEGFELVKYLNLGLLNPAKNEDSSFSDYGVSHQKLISQCPEYMTRKVTDLFLAKHGALLKSFKGSWFLPLWMGGLGMSGTLQEYNHEDRFYAFCAREVAAEQPHLVPSIRKEKEWTHFDLFNSFCKERGQGLVCDRNFEHYAGEETYGTVFSTIVYMKWISEGLHRLYNPFVRQGDLVERRRFRFYEQVKRRMDEYDALGKQPTAPLEIFQTTTKHTSYPVFSRRRV